MHRTGAVVLLAWMAWAAARTPLAGQEPVDTAAPAPAPVAPAPVPPPAPRLTFFLDIGVLGATDLQTQPVLAEVVTSDSTEPTTVGLRRTLRAESGKVAHAGVVLALARRWALQAGLGYGIATLAAGIDGEDDAVVDAARALMVPRSADLRVFSWEAGIRYRIPSVRRFQPYLDLGLAGEHWELAGDAAPFTGAAALAHGADRLGVTAGVGGTIPIVSHVTARLQASTRLFRTPLGPGPAGASLGASDAVTLTLEAPERTGFPDPTIELVRVIRLEAGVSVELGSVGRSDRSEEAERSPVPPG